MNCFLGTLLFLFHLSNRAQDPAAKPYLPYQYPLNRTVSHSVRKKGTTLKSIGARTGSRMLGRFLWTENS